MNSVEEQGIRRRKDPEVDSMATLSEARWELRRLFFWRPLPGLVLMLPCQICPDQRCLVGLVVCAGMSRGVCAEEVERDCPNVAAAIDRRRAHVSAARVFSVWQGVDKKSRSLRLPKAVKMAPTRVMVLCFSG
mmetsp:Transcript_66788/g.110959  ORF Transcript_66788/g.110959 Transcript_66788/m.110959 type:complete len:133 (+) Transcript_66788:390-788(+)